MEYKGPGSRFRAYAVSTQPPASHGQQWSQRPPEPALLAVLRSEHRYVAHLLRVLEELSATHRDQGPDRKILRDVMHYMTRYPDRHHHPKEDLIFGKMVARDPSARETVERLAEEHGEIGRCGAELLSLLERSYREELHDDELSERLGEYVARVRRHMELEEARIFARSISVLEPGDWAQAEEQMRSIDDPVFGGHIAMEYRSLFEHLTRDMSRIGTDPSLLEFFHIVATVESLSAVSEGMLEMGMLLAEHSARLLEDGRRALMEGKPGRGPGGLFAASRDLAVRHRENVRSTLREAGGILERTARGAARPYATWFRTVASLIGHQRTAGMDAPGTAA